MTTKTIFLSALLVLFAVMSQTAVAQEHFKPITVFLIRHAEREEWCN